MNDFVVGNDSCFEVIGYRDIYKPNLTSKHNICTFQSVSTELGFRPLTASKEIYDVFDFLPDAVGYLYVSHNAVTGYQLIMIHGDSLPGLIVSMRGKGDVR